MTIKVNRIQHTDVSNFLGHKKVGAEVSLGPSDDVRSVMHEIRDLAHECLYVRGRFHADDPSAVDFDPRRSFPESDFNYNSPWWVQTCLPHNELNIVDPYSGEMTRNVPMLNANEVNDFLERKPNLDHMVLLKTLKLQQEFRQNVTAVTHFPAVYWSMRMRLKKFVEDLRNLDWHKVSFTKEILSLYDSAVQRLEEGPISVFDINHLSQCMLRHWNITGIAMDDKTTSNQLRNALRDFTRGVQTDIEPFSYELPLLEPNSWVAVSGQYAHYMKLKTEQPRGKGVLYAEDCNWESALKDPRFAAEVDRSWSPHV